MAAKIIIWRFNPSKLCVVIQNHPQLDALITKASRMKNMCLSGQESQVLLSFGVLATHAADLYLTPSQLERIQTDATDWLIKQEIVA